MSFYNKPWAPGYSLPPYLADEDPLKQGSGRTTAQLPHGTFGPVPAGFKFGDYAQPQYVRDEPIGSHARTTPQLPDGTLPPVPARVKDSGNPWSDNTLESNGLGSLGNATLSEPTLPSGDPIKEYGHKAAAIVLETVNALPPGERSKALRDLLNEVDPGLHSAMTREAAKAQNTGEQDPMRAGLAQAFSRGMLDEFIRLGKGKKLSQKSQLGLGATWAQHSNYVQAAETHGLGGIGSFFSGALDKLGSAACAVAGNRATPLVAGAAGAYFGGPQSAGLATAGAGMAAGLCAPKPDAAPPGFMPGFSGAPSWALPAVIIGGGLALFLVLKK